MLIQEFQRIQENHKEAIQTKAARIVIGPSVGRVFQKDTVQKIWPVLTRINLGGMEQIESQEQYKEWFERQLSELAIKIEETNPGNKRIHPGYKWGRATKILCLFLNDIVTHRDYFSKEIAGRLIFWLYCPIDSFVMQALNRCGIQIPFSQIKEIDTGEKFFSVQNTLGQAAQQVGVPRIWFDDNWGDRQGD